MISLVNLLQEVDSIDCAANVGEILIRISIREYSIIFHDNRISPKRRNEYIIAFHCPFYVP